MAENDGPTRQLNDQPGQDPKDRPVAAAKVLERALFEIKRVIVGQDHFLERVLVALLARGHLLIEGVPGLAKTLTVKTVAEVFGGSFKRIQFTPDLVPSDLVGTRVYRPGTGDFTTELGPVFANFLLADEINRAPAKVQSALLEVMQEGQVTIGGTTYPVPSPFLVMATQNPIEHEGTYPLPEAQVDRFMLKAVVGYPSFSEELAIVGRAIDQSTPVEALMNPEELSALQSLVDSVYVDPKVTEYAVRLVAATRQPTEFGLGDIAPYISFGASPRASICLILAARSMAMLHGRGYAVPQDVEALSHDVLRHRIVLSYEAIAEGIDADQLVARIRSAVPPPRIDLRSAAQPR